MAYRGCPDDKYMYMYSFSKIKDNRPQTVHRYADQQHEVYYPTLKVFIHVLLYLYVSISISCMYMVHIM